MPLILNIHLWVAISYDSYINRYSFQKTYIHILSQTYNATLFLFDYFYVNAHALSKLFHSINSSFNQASNHILVLTICLKLAKNHQILSLKGGKKK